MSWIYPRWRDTAERWEWCAARRIDGKLLWSRSYATQEEAHAAAVEMESNRRFVRSVGDVTLRQACARAVTRLLGDGGSEHTATGYRAKFDKWFEIFDPEALLIDVTAEDIEHFKVERRTKHGAGNTTIRTDLTIMQRVFDLSGLRGDRNPVRGVVKPKIIEPNRPFLTMDDVRAIAERIRKEDLPNAAWHATVITFLAMTGARAFEIERLRKEHVEAAPEGGRCVVLHGAKGGRVRRVYVAPGLAQVAEDFVAGAAKEAPLAPVTIATICKRWAKKLGERRLSGRVLRRTFATEIARHLPLHYVQNAMGHSQLTTTQKYLGVDPRLALAAAAQLHSSLAGGASPPRRPRARKPAAGSARRGTRSSPPATTPVAASPASASHGSP